VNEKIEIEWDKERQEWCCMAPSVHGTFIYRGRTPVTALLAAVKAIGISACRHRLEKKDE
jgi:hypothetical protein